MITVRVSIINRHNNLPRSFYRRNPICVSRDLLGKLLIRKNKMGEIVGEIVETEAYIGPEDKASHAYNNKKTKRTYVQFKERGHAYVYKIYGIHHCFCVVVGSSHVPAVTLVRALKPIKGFELMKKNRCLKYEMLVYELTNGPSKICQAFDITSELNGVDLCNGKLTICQGEELTLEIVSSPRIGIDYTDEYKEVHWRFCIKDSEFVSR